MNSKDERAGKVCRDLPNCLLSPLYKLLYFAAPGGNYGKGQELDRLFTLNVFITGTKVRRIIRNETCGHLLQMGILGLMIMTYRH